MRYEDANYSRLEMSTEFFMIPVSVVHNSPVTEIEPTSSISVLRSPVPYQSSFFRREIWVPPLLVLSVLSMVLIVLFEVNLTPTSVLYKFSFSTFDDYSTHRMLFETYYCSQYSEDGVQNVKEYWIINFR